MEFLWQSCPSLSWIIFCTKCSLAGSFTNKLKLLDLLYSISQNSTCLWSYLFVNNELQNNCDSYCMEYWICLRQPISFGFFCRIIRIQRMPINILKIPKILRRLSCLFYRIYWRFTNLSPNGIDFSFNRNNIFDTFPMILDKMR